MLTSQRLSWEGGAWYDIWEKDCNVIVSNLGNNSKYCIPGTVHSTSSTATDKIGLDLPPWPENPPLP